MIGFKTGLILQTKSQKEFNLPETQHILCIPSVFSIDLKKEYLYSVEDGITVYTTNPFNKLKSCDYKKTIKDICAGPDCLYILSEDSLVFYSKNNFNVISADFKNSYLQLFDKKMIAVQNSKELVVFDSAFRRTAFFRCQCSFIIRDIFLIGFVTTLKAYVKDTLRFEIIMPAYITDIITDKLFSRIYCATQDNNIYCYDLSGCPLYTLEYHEKPVKQLKLSFCGKFLYSCDGHRICIWQIQHNVLIGFIDVDQEVEYFDTILVDEYKYDLEDCLI